MKIAASFFLFFFAFGVGMVSMRYFDFEVKDLLSGKGALLDSTAYLSGFYFHVALGIIALMIGPFQFLPKWRIKYLKTHRLLGKIYVSACLIGGVSGFIIAFFAMGGWITTLGFTLMATAWIITTSMAYLKIKAKDISAHQAWMIRSYAVTLAAVTLRIWWPLLEHGFGMDFIASYELVSFLSWIPNLFVAQWIINRQKLSPALS